MDVCRSREGLGICGIYFVFLLQFHFFFFRLLFSICGKRKTMMIFQNLVKGAVVTAFFASSVGAVDNGLAITPQMGCESYSPILREILLMRSRG
jgi:hypothetical protein